MTSLFEWCQFCFKLNTFVVVELYVCTYKEASFLISFEFGAVDALGFEDREEIFRRKQIVFLQDTKNSFRILVYSLPFKPYRHISLIEYLSL